MLLAIGVLSAVPSIEFISPTPSNNSNVSANYLEMAVTVEESGLSNVTFILLDENLGYLDSAVLFSSPFTANFTGLGDGAYYFQGVANYTDRSGAVTDGNSLRKATVDTTFPVADLTNGTTANGSSSVRDWIFINVTANESNLLQIQINIFNDS